MANVLDEFRLTDRVAMVTGSGSGLGRAFAQALAEAGADVACVDLRREAAEETAQEIRALGRRAIAVGADVSREDDAIAMVKATVDQLGGLDIAFANAGIAESFEPLIDSHLANWQKTIDVDLTGVYLTAREAAKAMVPRKRGKIVSTASILGFVANPRPGRGRAYVSAKAGVVNLTRSLAIELAPHNIQVNGIAPTFTRTNVGGGILRGETEDSQKFVAEIVERTPIGRLGLSEEFKGVAVFLASDASNLITGATIPVDGGYLAW